MTFHTVRVIFYILLFLSLSEIALEMRAYLKGWDTLLLGEIPRVGEEKVLAGNNKEFGPTEAFPFRSRIVPQEKADGTIRYWIASSSHAEDVYLAAQLIFPNILEDVLKHSGVKATVLNASYAGQDIEGNLRLLNDLGQAWKPDYVILYQLSQSVGSLAKRVLAALPLSTSSSREGEFTGGQLRNTWITRLIEKTTAYANLKGQVTSRIGASRVLSNSLGPRGEREFSELLRGFIRSVRAIGAVPILCTFATSHTRNDLGDMPQDIKISFFKYSSYLSVEGWIDTIERFNQIIREVAAEERVPMVDLEMAVSGHKEYFRDFVHFTPAGHEKVAETLRFYLVELEQALVIAHSR